MELVVQGIGTRIRERRRELKLTQRQVADRVGIGADVVSKHERGDLGVSAQTLFAYATVLETSADYLAGEADQPRRGATGKAVQRVTPPRGSDGIPKPLAKLLNDGRCNPLSDEEMAHLARHLDDGNSPELDDLEIHLLAYRAERDRTEDAISRFRTAVSRARKARKMAAPEPQAAAKTETRTKPELVR